MNQIDLLILLLLTAPLVSSLIALISPSNKSLIRSSSVSFSIVTLVILMFVFNQNKVQFSTWKWISSSSSSIDLTFEINQTTIPLALMTSFISLLINIYSIGFFKWDKNQSRYWSTLNLFTFSMLGLTLSGNLFQTFIFWEWIGLASYLLISFYRDETKAIEAGTKAFLMNKIGDAGFIIALMAIYPIAHTFNIKTIETSSIPNEISWMIGIGLCLAILSKSAQFPFHNWLPDAMEGPTPISALMHSATMVAAGVFILIRFHFLIPNDILQFITIVGIVTAFLGGFQALRESDLKKLLAWSTVSQLGLMIMVAGLNSFIPSYFYLLAHAIFKAGLFLMAGVLISNSGSNAIIDLKTSTKSTVLVITITFLVLSLMGFPLTLGFMAKEYIISSISSYIYLGIFFLISLLSILYAGRIFSIIYPIGEFKRTKIESLFLMTPIILLTIGTFWFTYSLSPFSISWIEAKWGLQSPTIGLTLFSFAWVILWSFVTLFLIRNNRINNLLNWLPSIQLDPLYRDYVIKPILFTAHISRQMDNKVIDKSIHGFVYANFSIALLIRWLDKVLIDGLVKLFVLLIRSIGNFFRQFVAGKIQDYIWWTLVTLIILFIVSRF